MLIVEDELLLRRILTLNLARRGHSVAEAESVESADEALSVSAVPFDAIVLDINLPDGTGWDILRHWENQSEMRESVNGAPTLSHLADPPFAVPRPPVIVLTAVRPVPQRIEEFQPAAVLLKPFPIASFLALVDRVLAGDLPHRSHVAMRLGP